MTHKQSIIEIRKLLIQLEEAAEKQDLKKEWAAIIFAQKDDKWNMAVQPK